MFVKQITSDRLIVGAPAKVNLFLQVLNRREDGYHNINSLFQAVSLFDRLTFTRTETPGIRIEVQGANGLSAGDDNLVAKAYRLMAAEFGLHGGLQIHLEKNIPIAAGLAGGSTDGAATLLACNLLYNLKLKRSRLAELALLIGSDLPFFFSSGQALVSGRGEVVREVSLPTDYWMALVTPAMGVSTPEAYRSLGRGLTIGGSVLTLADCRNVGELLAALELSGNDFEQAPLLSQPIFGEIKSALKQQGAVITRLSGSGPTVFGLFAEMPSLEREAELFRPEWTVHTVRPILLPTID